MGPVVALLCGMAALLAVHLLWTLKNWRFYRLCNQIPGPNYIPIVGNFFSILANNFDFIRMTYTYRAQYGHIYRIWLGHLVYVGLSQAKDVETIMSSQKFIHKSRDYKNLHPWLGTGLLTSTGSKWQHRRKIITPTFHFRILDRFMESFNRNSRILVEKMAKEDGRPAFDVHYYISLCTLDIICECAMGTTVNAQRDSTESSYVKAVNSMCWLLYYRGIRPWLRIPFIFNRTANGKLFNSNLQALHAMSTQVIKKRKEEFLKEQRRARKSGDGTNGLNNNGLQANDDRNANDNDRHVNGHDVNGNVNGNASSKISGKVNCHDVNGNVNGNESSKISGKVNGHSKRSGKGDGHDNEHGHNVNGTVNGHKEKNGNVNLHDDDHDHHLNGKPNGQRRRQDVAKAESLAARVHAATGLGDEDTDPNRDEAGAYGRKKRSAFLDHLLELAESENLSDDDIREEVDTIMFEGHDTTAAALSFALFSLATNQHIQDKLYDELHGIFGDSDREATFQDLANMKYLERVIKETLRLYPSVPLFWRDIREEVTLGSGYTLPAGATVALNMFMLGRNPDAFEDPELFDPDRFLTENWHGKHPFDYTPFSAGPRNCVGQKFAMLEMKVALSRVVRSFRLLPPPQNFALDLAVEVVLKSRSGVMVRLEKRTPPSPPHLMARAVPPAAAPSFRPE